MIKTARTLVLIMLALAIVAGPAMAQQTTAGVGATAPGMSETKTFTLGDNKFSINTIGQVDASRLQEMGVSTVSVPAGTTVYVTYSATSPQSTGMAQAPKNMIVFGPNGYAGAAAWTGSPADKSIQPYTFTGTSGQYYVIAQRSDGSVKDMMLVSFD
ncbi:MAG: hypothetical protein WBZ29_04840 [Methanocella sp.]